MSPLRILDLTALAFFAWRRASPAARRVGMIVALAAAGWAGRPVSCSCIRPPFARCDPSLAYRAALRSDLKALASQQEIHFADAGSFSADPSALAFVASQGVTVRIEASEEAWSARAVHDRLGDGAACRVFVDRGASPSADLVCGG